jgi:hypothetical protein
MFLFKACASLVLLVGVLRIRKHDVVVQLFLVDARVLYDWSPAYVLHDWSPACVLAS